MTTAHEPDYKLSEVAKITGLNLRTLQNLAKRGELDGCYRIGGSYRVRRDALDRLRGVESPNVMTSSDCDLMSAAT